MNKKKELAKNTAILTFGKICTQSISFLLLPLYTAILDTTDYGTFDLLITYATLFLPLVNWQLDQGIFRFLLDARNDKEKQSGLFSTVFCVNTLQVLIFTTILGLFTAITKFRHGYFLIVYVVLHVYTALLLQFVRGLGRNTVYAIASFISAVMIVIFNVIALVVLKWQLSGLLASTIVSQTFTILYLMYAIKPWEYFNLQKVQRELGSQVVKYSLPLIPNNLAWWVVNVSDRMIVSHILGVAVNGIYTVANKFSNVFINFYNIVNLSWTESVSVHFNDEDRDEFLSETITILYRLFSCACFGIVALMPYIFPIMVNEKYNIAYNHVLILMYAMLLRVIVGLYSSVYIAQKNSKKIAYTSMAAALLNISIHLFLIGKIGLYAASLSTVAAFGIMAVIRYIDINKTIKMRISHFTFVSSVAVGIVLAIFYYINSKIGNAVMLLIVVCYSVAMNVGLLKNGAGLLKKLKSGKLDK